LYPSLLETPPLAAFLMQTSQSQLHTIPTNDQGTLKTVPWAAAFMAGTRAALIGRYEGKIIDKAQLQQMLSKGIKPH
jgi:hypothetical protein